MGVLGRGTNHPGTSLGWLFFSTKNLPIFKVFVYKLFFFFLKVFPKAHTESDAQVYGEVVLQF